MSQAVLQLHLMFGDNVIGPKSENELYGKAASRLPGI